MEREEERKVFGKTNKQRTKQRDNKKDKLVVESNIQMANIK